MRHVVLSEIALLCAIPAEMGGDVSEVARDNAALTALENDPYAHGDGYYDYGPDGAHHNADNACPVK